MNLLSNIRAKRNTAWLVLLAWLFAVASGVANACVLEARGTHHQAAVAGLSGTAQPSVVSAGHAGAVADRAGDPHAAKVPCLKTCDDSAQSVPKRDLTAAQTDPGPAHLVAVLWTAATPVLSPPSRMGDVQPVAPERPIRVRYPRLAL